MSAEKEKKIRLFYALWPDEATREALLEWQKLTNGRRSVPQNLHLTMAFLGEQPAALLPRLQALLEPLPGLPFDMTLDKLGTFRRSAIAWAGMSEPPQALFNLRNALVEAVDAEGVSLDKSPFKPHVTLARKAALSPQADHPQPERIAWRADHLALVQSTIFAEGPRYDIVASRWLRDSSASST